MTRNFILAMITAVVLAKGTDQLACAAPPDQPTQAAPAQQATPPVNAPAEGNALPSPNQLWDVNMLRCKDWLDASDDDRTAAGMFYYGWLAGARGIHAIRPAAIQPNLHKVLDYCAQHRDTTIVKAFEATLLSSKKG